MSDNPPSLLIPGQELYNVVQIVNALGVVVAKLRDRLDRDGRLANADDEHAAALHEARQHPPLRLMNEQEQQDWRRSVLPELAAEPHGEPFTVWTAQLADAQGRPTGEWGLEAHTWDRGRVTSSLFIALADPADAVAMTRYLRAHGTADQVDYLYRLAAEAPGRSAAQPVANAAASPTASGRRTDQAASPGLTEGAWEAALRRALPAPLADSIVVKDPLDPHHSAWRELVRLANHEVRRVGADPDRLAELVRSLKTWKAPLRNPPACAYTVIVDARLVDGYAQRVRPVAPPSATAEVTTTVPGQARSRAVGSDVNGRIRGSLAEATVVPKTPSDIHDPAQALAFANSLDKDDVRDRIAARHVFGRWGPEADGVLARKFPGLTEQARQAGDPRGWRDALAGKAGSISAAEIVDQGVDPAVVEQLKADVERLDPAKYGDRMAARYLLGHSKSEAVDQLIAARFHGDEWITNRVAEVYPDGFGKSNAEVGTAASPRSAQDDELHEAAAPATPGDRTRQPRKDVAGEQAPVVRRVLQAAPPAPGVRRT
jgi:hypothetical protein